MSSIRKTKRTKLTPSNIDHQLDLALRKYPESGESCVNDLGFVNMPEEPSFQEKKNLYRCVIKRGKKEK